MQTTAPPCQAVDHLTPQNWICNVQNFHFANGEKLPELTMHYSTLGTPQHDAQGKICNAVLLLHSSSGNRLHWLSEDLTRELFGHNQPLDAQRFFVIVPDLIGHGQSSKPSDGLRTSFPAYRCRDMVNAAHLLVTQGLGIGKLQLVMGTSLGAMLAWLWAQMYSDSAARVVPISAYPLALGGRNWIIRRMMIEAIRHDPAWAQGHYNERPTTYLYTAPLLFLMAHGVQQLQDLAPNQSAADKYFAHLMKTAAQHDTNDLLYIIEATLDYDPAAGLQDITAHVLAINFEGDAICCPEVEMFEASIRQIPGARSVLIAADRQSAGHFTYFQVNTWKAHLAEFLEATKGVNSEPLRPGLNGLNG